MKGVIYLAAKELVTNNFGKDKWEAILKDAGIEKEPLIMSTSNVDDDLFFKVVGSIKKILSINDVQLADAFGDYWVNVYSQKLYDAFYENSKSAKEFLLNMDNVHRIMTQNLQGAKPPHFEYEQPDEKTLIMIYHSDRGLIDFVVGLAKGVGKYYKENITVRKLDDKRVEIKFE